MSDGLRLGYRLRTAEVRGSSLLFAINIKLVFALLSDW